MKFFKILIYLKEDKLFTFGFLIMLIGMISSFFVDIYFSYYLIYFGLIGIIGSALKKESPEPQVLDRSEDDRNK